MFQCKINFKLLYSIALSGKCLLLVNVSFQRWLFWATKAGLCFPRSLWAA